MQLRSITKPIGTQVNLPYNDINRHVDADIAKYHTQPCFVNISNTLSPQEPDIDSSHVDIKDTKYYDTA